MECRINKINKMARKANGPGFTQRSGKSPVFKMMGSSSPVKEVDYAANLAAAKKPRRHDSQEAAMAYINSPQYNIDRLGEQRGTGINRMFRTAEGDWRGVAKTTHHGGRVTYSVPEFAKLSTPFDPKYGDVTYGNPYGPKRQKFSRGFHRKAAIDAARRQQEARELKEHNLELDELGTEDFWSQYS